MPIFYYPEKAKDAFGPSLDKGYAKRSPELGPMDVVAGGLLAVGDDVNGVLDMARPLMALYVGGMGAVGQNFYNALITRYGYEEEAKQIQELYLAGKKEEAAAAIPTELLEHTNLVGPEGYVKERIAAYKEAGVTVLNVTPFDAAQPARLEKVKGWL